MVPVYRRNQAKVGFTFQRNLSNFDESVDTWVAYEGHGLDTLRFGDAGSLSFGPEAGEQRIEMVPGYVTGLEVSSPLRLMRERPVLSLKAEYIALDHSKIV